MKNQTNSIEKHIGLRIKFIRNLRHLSILATSKMLGISRVQLRNYEGGKADIRVSRLNDIAKLMGVNLSFFFEGFCENEELPEDAKTLLINYGKIKDNDIKNSIAALLNELS